MRRLHLPEFRGKLLWHCVQAAGLSPGAPVSLSAGPKLRAEAGTAANALHRSSMRMAFRGGVWIRNIVMALPMLRPVRTDSCWGRVKIV
jgi:hypothetical protein